ncbi:MAG: GntR family transcriptional regulator [Tabrizicola sp.]|nr:GntR family transcriptional regulator [Tabrizicola sp.]
MNHPGAFRPERTNSLSHQLYDLLLDRICRFELKPNQRLSETTLSEQLGVSRTPAREALARLAEQGLVDILPQRGSRVAPLRLDDLEKSQFMREALELAILRRAMEGAARADLAARLRDEITLQRAYVSVRDKEQFYLSDDRFHGHIASCAGRAAVVPELTRVKLHMDRFRHLMVDGVEDLPVVIGQHEDIAGAIEAGDMRAAEDRMRLHLRRIFSYVGEARTRFPEYFEERAD